MVISREVFDLFYASRLVGALDEGVTLESFASAFVTDDGAFDAARFQRAYNYVRGFRTPK